jgi:hypothetical protein
VCQGDLVFDANQGKWGRVEGGCTKDFNENHGPYRIDWWKGSASKSSLENSSFTGRFDSFTVFPGGVVNKDFASKYGRIN